MLEGGTLQGFISDILQRRAPVLALSLLLAIGSLVGYSREYSFAVVLFPGVLGTSICPEPVGQPWGEPVTSSEARYATFVSSCECLEAVITWFICIRRKLASLLLCGFV